MKKVEYDGLQYEVPDAARYIAADATGAVYWYYSPPSWEEGMWVSSDGSSTRVYPMNKPATCVSLKPI